MIRLIWVRLRAFEYNYLHILCKILGRKKRHEFPAPQISSNPSFICDHDTFILCLFTLLQISFSLAITFLKYLTFLPHSWSQWFNPHSVFLNIYTPTPLHLLCFLLFSSFCFLTFIIRRILLQSLLSLFTVLATHLSVPQ